MAALTIAELADTLAATAVDYSIRPGMAVSATFRRRELRDGLRDRFRGAQVAAAGQTFTLNRDRTWADEHGYGLTLWPV